MLDILNCVGRFLFLFIFFFELWIDSSDGSSSWWLNEFLFIEAFNVCDFVMGIYDGDGVCLFLSIVFWWIFPCWTGLSAAICVLSVCSACIIGVELVILGCDRGVARGWPIGDNDTPAWYEYSTSSSVSLSVADKHCKIVIFIFNTKTWYLMWLTVIEGWCEWILWWYWREQIRFSWFWCHRGHCEISVLAKAEKTLMWYYDKRLMISKLCVKP